MENISNKIRVNVRRNVKDNVSNNIRYGKYIK